MEEGIFGDAYLSTFLLSPDGSKIAWNVNVITGLSPVDAGTSRQRHVIYRADIDGKNRELVLEQNYDRPEDQTRRAWRVHGRAMRTGLAGQSACASWGVPCVER
jgi:hypothetical protein